MWLLPVGDLRATRGGVGVARSDAERVLTRGPFKRAGPPPSSSPSPTFSLFLRVWACARHNVPSLSLRAVSSLSLCESRFVCHCRRVVCTRSAVPLVYSMNYYIYKVVNTATRCKGPVKRHTRRERLYARLSHLDESTTSHRIARSAATPCGGGGAERPRAGCGPCVGVSRRHTWRSAVARLSPARTGPPRPLRPLPPRRAASAAAAATRGRSRRPPAATARRGGLVSCGSCAAAAATRGRRRRAPCTPAAAPGAPTRARPRAFAAARAARGSGRSRTPTTPASLPAAHTRARLSASGRGARVSGWLV